MVGIDATPAMLDHARARAAKAGVKLDLQEGDVRDLALEEPAALVYCQFGSLLHLPPGPTAAAPSSASPLPAAGRAVCWNALAFDHQIAARLDGEHQPEPVPHTVRYWVGDNRVDLVLDDGARSSRWWATKNEVYNLNSAFLDGGRGSA